MIISCINCNKKFEVNADLIPSEGRNIQCGSCNHIWFFKKDQKKIFEDPEIDKDENKPVEKTVIEHEEKIKKVPKKTYKPSENKKKSSELIKYESSSKFTFGNFLSYIMVFIISFITLIIIIDTFKSPLYDLIPSLELILFNFYEVLKDVKLFIKDLF
tara:strand:+ start:118 stop:591 length:474 start_codon:yes stop_codon:yes gene_type:complete